MNERLAKWAAGFTSIDFVLFSMAEEAILERARATWQDYTYPDNYPQSNRQGKHPSTFKGFLEGLSWELRQMGAPCSAGQLDELMAVYEAAAQLGMTAQQMAFVSVRVMTALHRRFGGTAEFSTEIKNAYEIKQHTGTYFLPSFDRPGTIKYMVEYRKHPSGKVQMMGFSSIRDGEAHRNFFADEAEFHYFLKRTRATAVERAEER